MDAHALHPIWLIFPRDIAVHVVFLASAIRATSLFAALLFPGKMVWTENKVYTFIGLLFICN